MSEKFQEIFNSDIEEEYTVLYDGLKLNFRIGEKKIYYKYEEKKCIFLKDCTDEHGKKSLYLRTYYYRPSTRNLYALCGKIPHKKMFDLITMFAKGLGISYVSLHDEPTKYTENCDWDLGLFQKLVTGESFYEKYGFQYKDNDWFENQEGFSILNKIPDDGPVRKWFEENDLNKENHTWIDVLTKMRIECINTKKNVKVVHKELKKLFEEDYTSFYNNLMYKNVNDVENFRVTPIFEIDLENKVIKITTSVHTDGGLSKKRKYKRNKRKTFKRKSPV